VCGGPEENFINKGAVARECEGGWGGGGGRWWEGEGRGKGLKGKTTPKKNRRKSVARTTEEGK